MDKSPLHSIPSRRSWDGFTLVEVLVSSAILALLILLLIGMVDGASRIWRDGERRREVIREARAGIEILTEDLHSAVRTTNPMTLFIQQESKEKGGQRIFLLVSHPREKREPGNEGDLCATGYFVASDPHDGDSPNLYRFHLSGKPVAEAFENGRLESLYASASPKNTLNTELLARHILELSVHHIPEDSSASDPNSSDLLLISLSAVGGETARLLSSDPKTKEARDRNANLLKQHLQRYSTIVRLPPVRDLPNVSKIPTGS